MKSTADLDPRTLRYAIRVLKRRVYAMERDRKAIRRGPQNAQTDFHVGRLIGEMHGIDIAIGVLNIRATRIEKGSK